MLSLNVGNHKQLRTNSSLSHYRDLPIEFSTDTFILGIGIGPVSYKTTIRFYSVTYCSLQIDDQTPLIPLLPPQISINSAPLVADQIPCSSTSSATIPTAEPSLDSTIPSSSNEPAPISTISQPTTISSSTSRYRWSSKDKELLIKTINETRSLNPKFNTDWKEVAKVFEGRYSEQQCRSKVYNDKSVTSRLLRKEKKSECNGQYSYSSQKLEHILTDYESLAFEFYFNSSDSIPPKKIIDKKSPASTSSTNTLVVSSDPVISTTAVSQESKQISTGSHKVVTPVSTSKTTALNQWDQDSLTRLIIAIRDTPETAYKWTEIVRRVGGGRTVRECQAVWEHILTNPELASTFARFFGKDKLC